MQLRAILQLLLVSLVGIAQGQSGLGKRVLAVLDPAIDRDDFSEYLSVFTDYDVTYSDPKSMDAHLFEHEQRSYDHLLLFCSSSKGLGPELTAKAFVQFLNEGGNILVATSDQIPDAVRELASQAEIHFAPRDSLLVDHFSNDETDESHKRVFSSYILATQTIVSKELCDKPIIFEGVAHSIGNGPQLVPVFRASRTSYTYDTKDETIAAEDPFVIGSQSYLVSALQGRNDARLVMAGSVSMFSNNFFNTRSSKGPASNGVSNRGFTHAITRWALKETQVLKPVYFRHRKADSEEVNPRMYRMNDEVVIELGISEASKGHWTPFVADDVQVEFVMLDPYIRTTMEYIGNSNESSHAAHYRKKVKLPDHHGVFTFKVEYRRPGLSPVEVKDTVTIRHYWHNEYARFLLVAYPYYSTSLVVSMSFVLFVFLWLFNTDRAVSLKAAEKKKS